ncbi:DUF6249 domain-containing protein [Asticcacaulis benevestitus]|jgi:uncharacterized ion transporter superfamily protein YfcC|uniref:DUF6249 domain-containing protein n=1 Tax=Asticcacaulis benevestitus DSM 16100 = ATCC BAA-896 TaxID=1121022 RepID=V4Q951_9CAUL|nr:DUF6249 domain-containing protein [Asticcacaulis benevestitus]ESQ94395.1 hypothetical protein ABENE_02495 [Asticcacaulis benevestitus DSM 16100 = ATCC BAA-896]
MDWDSATGLIAVIMIFGMPVFVVGIIFFFIYRSRQETQKTLRMAIEKSDSLPPEFLDTLKSLQKKPKTPANDIRTGLILIAIALGIVVWNFLDNGYTVDEMSGLAAIPGFIGVALLVLGLIGNRKQ